jgi:uncharacterized phage protein (TIGR01671 family)
MNNRQIKFRVWNVDEKFFYTDPNSIKIDINGQIQRLYKGNEYVGDIPFWGEIYSEIVIQQFTGLTDKNGKEIYEGDILNVYISLYREFHQGKVIWREDLFGFYVEMEKHYYCPLPDLNQTREWNKLGNIFENPELLAP